MSELIRARSLTGYSDLVRQLGGDPNRLLQEFAIDPSLIDAENAVIPYGNFIRLMEATAQALSCAEFGLKLAERQGLNILGPLALLAQNSETVGDGVNAVTRYISHYSAAVRVGIDSDPHPNLRRITYVAMVAGCVQRGQTIELTLGIMARFLKLLAGNNFRPDHVLFRHAANRPHRRYQDWFSCPALFEQDVNALAIEAAILERPIEKSNPELLRLVKSYVEGVIEQRPLNVVGQVRVLIDDLLPTCNCSQKQIAYRLCMHERTLRRRLADAGLTFDAMLDQTRRQRAMEYLTQTNLSMAQVASMLGLAEQSSFSRACRRWFGSGPTAVRKRGVPAC